MFWFHWEQETCNISSELFRVKNTYDESDIQLEEVQTKTMSLERIT